MAAYIGFAAALAPPAYSTRSSELVASEKMTLPLLSAATPCAAPFALE